MNVRARFGLAVLRNAVLGIKGFVGWAGVGVFLLALVGVTLASIQQEHTRAALGLLFALMVVFAFEGAFRTWEAEARKAANTDARMDELRLSRYDKLHRQMNAVDSALIDANHIRNDAIQNSSSEHIRETARLIDSWITRTKNSLEAVGLQSGTFLADTGDYGSGVFAVSDRIELQNAMRARQLKRLDRHLERLRTEHERLANAKETSYAVLYGETG
jgi:hypothetical protein